MSDCLWHMDCSMPGFPVHHQLPELAQAHVHRVRDAIQPSHPLSSPSPPMFNLSQHQGLFQRVNSLHQMAKVLEVQFQHQSFQWIFRTDFLGLPKETSLGFPVAHLVKNLPAFQETCVWSLCWEDPLEKRKATQSSILPQRIPWKEEPGRLQSMGSQRAGHDWVMTNMDMQAYGYVASA